MSHILESVLDAERRAQCEQADRDMAAGIPIRMATRRVEIPPSLRIDERPPEHKRKGLGLSVKCCIAAWTMGFVVGLPVGASNKPAVRPHLQMDTPDDVQRVPGVKPPTTHQRTVV